MLAAMIIMPNPAVFIIPSVIKKQQEQQSEKDEDEDKKEVD